MFNLCLCIVGWAAAQYKKMVMTLLEKVLIAFSQRSTHGFCSLFGVELPSPSMGKLFSLLALKMKVSRFCK